MDFKWEEATRVLTDKNSMLALTENILKYTAPHIIEGHQSSYYAWAVEQIKRNIEITFNHCQAEVEKKFLSPSLP